MVIQERRNLLIANFVLAALFLGGGFGYLFDMPCRGWEVGVGVGIFIAGMLNCCWSPEKWFQYLSLLCLGLYLISLPFLVDIVGDETSLTIITILSKYGYLCIGIVYAILGIRSYLKSD